MSKIQIQDPFIGVSYLVSFYNIQGRIQPLTENMSRKIAKLFNMTFLTNAVILKSFIFTNPCLRNVNHSLNVSLLYQIVEKVNFSPEVALGGNQSLPSILTYCSSVAIGSVNCSCSLYQ